MKVYRIAGMRHPIFSGEGARQIGGRWNSPGHSVIYAGDSLATCLLEILVHTRGVKPPGTLGWIEIDVPDSVSIERIDPDNLPGWGDLSSTASQAFGDLWIKEARSCLLWVPSVAASGLAWNAVINTAHPEFALISSSVPQALRLDSRLFP
ncbi:MAG: RES domain-containing protein [Chlorobia bacterium]|nr:RES domain-containing protein [Fimbriimonadaceae bacterium]